MTSTPAKKVVVVTGGASGIGHATAERFLHQGACVVFGDLNTDTAEAFLTAQHEHRERLMFLETDVSSEEQVEALVQKAAQSFGRLDVMVNNAGVGGAFGPVTDIAVEDWDLTFAVLVRSVFLGIKHAARVMIPAGGGSIVNTASIAAFSGGAAGLAYSAAKAAIVNLTKASAAELGPRGIRVNVVAPGLIATPMAADVPDTAVHRVVHELQPLHTVGRAEDVAAAIAWLASAEAGFVTGEAVTIDGGLSAAGTRMLDALDPDGAAMHAAGFGYGSTGRPMTVRAI